MEGPLEQVLQHGADGNALDPLAAPVGREVFGRKTPDFFRIAGEKGPVEFFSEPVDHEIFQGVFRPFVEAGIQVGTADSCHGRDTQVPDGGPVQGYRVIEEFVPVQDPGYPLAAQKYPVRLFRIHSLGIQGAGTVEQPVVQSRGGSTGHETVPQSLDTGVFGEEAVAADVHPVAGKVDGAGKAAHLGIGFQNQGVDGCGAQKFIGSRKPRRPGPNDYSLFCHVRSLFCQ